MGELTPVGRTALGAALWRIAHLLVDGEPKIFVDTLAQRLLGVSDEDVIKAKAAFPESTAAWVLRSRYAEDRLAEARARGVEQYVVLGAGLDTFAYRTAGAFDGLRVFEVDTPESQSWKRGRLERAGIEIPASCEFVPCNFETQSLAEAFAGSTLDPSRPAFVSWLAVTMYLQREAIEKTLRWIAGLGPRTELVLTYCVPEARAAGGVQFADQMGARFLSFFSMSEMERFLRETGFEETRPLTFDEARSVYFSGRTDGLQPSTTEFLMWARVSPLDRAEG
ncbi:MAG: class I SAM-dependent methyltransferase [Myxococcota bacterium]|nr:class I SAM-dependent methyltransferase [Myxococcota bacterium]